MSDALGHFISWLQPTSLRFIHLSPFQVQKFQGRISLALLDQVSISGPTDLNEGAGLQITNMMLPVESKWMGREDIC